MENEKSHKRLQRLTLYFSSFKNCVLKVKLWWVGAWKEKECIFCNIYFARRKFFNICFISMYSVLNTFSQYICFYISKNITSLYLLLVLKTFESRKCILNKVSNYLYFCYVKSRGSMKQDIEKLQFCATCKAL